MSLPLKCQPPPPSPQILRPGAATVAAVVQELELQVEKARIPHEDKEEMKFVVTQPNKNIEAWEAHILRFINQDEACLDILKAADDSSVLVVLDWAMMFIPRKYRESQADWFGKRGLS